MLIGPTSLCVVLIGFGSLPCALPAQPPPPRPPHGAPPAPPPPPKGPVNADGHIAAIQRRLEQEPPSTPEAHELIRYSKDYLAKAREALQNGRVFEAGKLADAADACRRPIDHLQRLSEPARRREPPPPRGLDDQMRQIYFRLRLSDYFLERIPAPQPQSLLELARKFYQDAMKANQSGNTSAAEQYGKAADDLTHALEDVAQAYAPAPPAPLEPPARPPR